MSLEAKRKRRVIFAFAATLLLLSPVRVEAHLNTTGLGPVYDGLIHFLISPEDFIPVLALALFAGLRGKEHCRRALFLLPAAWLGGGIVGLVYSIGGGTTLPAVSFLLLGGLVAADVKLSAHVTTVLAMLLGIFHGYLNGAAMGRPSWIGLALLGLVVAVFVVTSLVTSFVVGLRWHWTRIAVRVIGSWIVASGLLMIGWALRRG